MPLWAVEPTAKGHTRRHVSNNLTNRTGAPMITRGKDGDATLSFSGRFLIQVVLANRPDLRKNEYDNADHPLAGHCYVASEVAYHILSEHDDGWTPQVVRVNGDTHWFLRHDNGHVLDLTEAQFDKPVPHRQATGKGFLTKQPSKRAQTVLDILEGQR